MDIKVPPSQNFCLIKILRNYGSHGSRVVKVGRTIISKTARERIDQMFFWSNDQIFLEINLLVWHQCVIHVADEDELGAH